MYINVCVYSCICDFARDIFVKLCRFNIEIILFLFQELYTAV